MGVGERELRPFKRVWLDVLAGLESFLFHPYCVLCEQRLTRPSQLVCDGCLAELPAAKPAILRGEDLHEDSRLAVFACVASLWQYSEQVEKVIHLLKYRRRPALAGVIGVRMAPLGAELTEWSDTPVVFVPVPLHSVRLRERGYNQSALLARCVAEGIGVSLALRSLVRRRYTRSQAALGREERLRNVEGAFEVTSSAEIAGKHCVLVDDVVTTGATSSVCAEALLRAGAAAVSLLTAARA